MLDDALLELFVQLADFLLREFQPRGLDNFLMAAPFGDGGLMCVRDIKNVAAAGADQRIGAQTG
jgi:hypothetical protein